MNADPALEPITVLMVEDDADQAQLARLALREARLRLSLEIVGSGEAALAELRRRAGERRTPDLLLLDMKLPGMDGRDVLEHIRADPALRAIPVVVLMASSSDADYLAKRGVRAEAFVSKPVRLETFAEIVRKVPGFEFTIARQAGPEPPARKS